MKSCRTSPSSKKYNEMSQTPNLSGYKTEIAYVSVRMWDNRSVTHCGGDINGTNTLELLGSS